jgi:pimeloyl-ACP methyl ester carboxylesterase
MAATAAALRVLGRPRDHGPLFVRRLGGRGPRVLCLHGLFGSGAFWMGLAGPLAGELRFAIPDLPGFGRSPQPEADYTVDFHLKGLAPVVDEGPPWIVLGHSMGCVLAVELALRRPRDVAGVLLFNAPVYASAARRREIFGRQNLMTRLAVRSPVSARVICEALVCTPRPLMTRIAPWLRPDLPPDSASDYFRHTFTSYYTSLRHLVFEEDLLARMAELRRPTWVVQGKRDALVDAPETLRWPGSIRLQVLEGVDHTSLLFHEPGRAAGIVRDFLRETSPA